MHRSKDARHHTNKAIRGRTPQPDPALLAQRAGNVIVGPAVVRFSRPAGDQHLRRAGFRGIGVEALALLEALGSGRACRRQALQSGAPLAETGHIMRPATIEDGLARRDRLSASPASLARAFKSSMVSCGLFSVGRIDRDFSNNFPDFVDQAGILFARRRRG